MQWLSFYQKFFPTLKSNAVKQNVACPFHDDKQPSLSLDLETGLFYCHGCHVGGDVFSFHMKWHACSFTAARRAILGSDRTPVLSIAEVTSAHEKLLQSEPMQKVLLVKRGWNLETIEKLQLGFIDERVTIPIISKRGDLLNIRKYDVFHKSKEKFKGVVGHNTIRLWPDIAFEQDLIVIFAGEPDTILARQLGINGVTFTGGEGAFRADLLPHFTGKKVYICYDVDEQGKTARNALSRKLAEHAAEVYLIDLPTKILPANGDFSDLFFYAADNETELTELWNPLVKKAIKVEKELAVVLDDSEYNPIDFYDAVKDKYYNTDISFKAIAIGKNFSPYFAPKKIYLSCDFTRGDTCTSCMLFATGGKYTLEVPDEKILDLIRCTQSEQRNKLKNMVGVKGCNQFKMDMEAQTIEEIYLSPIVDSEKIDRQFIVRKAYTKSYNLQLNKTYSFFGKSISDAKTQEATQLFDKQKPELTTLDKFKLTEDDIKDLKIFNPRIEGMLGIDEKIKQITRDLSYNIPELIIGREKLMFAYDLVFHSVLKFKLLGSLVEKGWVELLALGDTRTGKTKTAVKLCKHYRAGEYITLESATLPGLIGGMFQVGKEMSFAWGVLPINDGRLVIMDEVNGLDQRDISNMSSIRDNGIAERTVVGSTRKTTARVRLIWISNPRSATVTISNYSSGIEAIKELMGRPEDISRLDLAIIVAKEDVSVGDMNKLSHLKPVHLFTSDLCHKCLLWAWSRKKDQVKFTPEAEKAILKYAISMSKKYSDTIPLVQGSVQRIKLAKLSVALACRLFSTTDGENVIVREEHVDYIVSFLYDIYDSPIFGYEEFSTRRREEVEASTDKVEMEILKIDEGGKFIKKMLGTNAILFDDLVDFSGRSRDYVKGLKTLLVTNNCIIRKKQYFIKQPQFTTLLKEMLRRKEMEVKK